ncbi:MAG: hypothetical protein IE887_07310, partial [Campylobacterales bacterium]|nr:hypothetical protein [Campylobacterales bacterium]
MIYKLFTIKRLLLVIILSVNLYGWEKIYGGRGNFNTDPNFHLLYGGAGYIVKGDFTATGNSILRSNNPLNANLITDTTTYKLDDGNFTSSTYSLGDSEKRNSSKATLNLPPYVQGSDIVWAGLFWQGHIYRKNGKYDDSSVDSDIVGWNKVTLRDSLGTYHALTAPVGSDDSSHKAFYHTITNGTGYRHHYGAYVDVTSIVQNSYSSTNNTFTVGNIKTTAGNDGGGYVYITQSPTYSGNFRFGLYGGWSLIVVYDVDGAVAAANNVKAKNVSIYDGFDLFLTWGKGTVPFETTINIDGFYTPKSGTVNSSMLLFGGAGDRHIKNDTLAIEDGNNLGTYDNMNNTANPLGKQFNHTYSLYGAHMTPSDPNKQGMDLDIYDVSSSMANKQSSTKIKFGVVKSNGYCDQIFPQVIGFSTQLYEPQFCYDYAYKQQGQYFTEDNNGSKDPSLAGDVLKNEPVEVTVFLRNLVDSDLKITDMNISITDINTTQATYINNSVQLAKNGDLVPASISDASLTVASGYIKNVPIGDMDSNDFFYLYYNVNPLDTTLDMPIKVTASYNLVVNPTNSIPYTLTLGADVPMCSTTNFAYTPSKGIYNVVHNNYYDLDTGGSSPYYNLPTQVVNREGNFKVISLDENNTDALEARGTMVAVELIDVSAFHDTEASCMEQASSISPRVWVMIYDTVNDKNATSVPFTQSTIAAAIADGRTEPLMASSSEFYDYARENAAFRVSYNLTNDGNDDLVKITPGSKPNTYSINFTELVQNVGQCGHEVWNPQNYNNKTTNVSVACSNNSDKMTARDIAVCLECIYGINTKYICSRDNFAIRPEAFLMQLNDQNQTVPTIQTDITTFAHSGSAGASAPEFHLASGYDYDLEVNATNFLNNTSSAGYTKTMNITNDDPAIFEWTPRSSITSGACNDENNGTVSARFLDGTIDTNTSLAQVGEYTLRVLDTTWTDVDHNPLYMGHHTGSYFIDSNTPDCIVGSNAVQAINSGTNNGCNISSSHLANNGIQYNNYEITFHPYKFSIDTNLTIGDENKTVAEKPYVYMANISENESISVHFLTDISALGYNNSALSNYVTGCFSQDTLFSIGKSATTATNVSYSYLTHDLNSSNARISGLDVNGTIAAGDLTASPLMTLPANFWQKDQNGVLAIETNLNFNRAVNIAVNPEDINFTTLQADDNVTL